MSKSLAMLGFVLFVLLAAATAGADSGSTAEPARTPSSSTNDTAPNNQVQLRVTVDGMILSRGGLDFQLSTPLVISSSDLQEDRPRRDDAPFRPGVCVRVGFNF